MPAGRPPDYNPVFCEMLREHMAEGKSFESFAGKIGTWRSTLYNWADKFPEFMDAKKIGAELSLLFWEQNGIDGTIGKLKGFNAASWIYNMKCRFKGDWLDIQKVEQSTTMDLSVAAHNSLIDLSLQARSQIQEKKGSNELPPDDAA